MSSMLSPSNEEELAAAIAGAQTPLRLVGRGSKLALGNPVEATTTLSLAAFTGLELYEPEELILEAGAATPLADLEKWVAARGQMLAFEPPDFSTLLGVKQKGSIGGIVAANLSGPRRLKAGAARDHVLGLRCVTGRAEIQRTGARVVKNVTGYDLPKLLTGAYGTLAAITRVTLKVLPRPETEETLVFRGLSDAEAIRLMSAAMQSPADVSGAAHVPGDGTYLRLDGIAPSIAFRRDRLIKTLARDAGVLPDPQSQKLWQRLRDVEPFWKLKDQVIWRVSTTPSEAPGLVAKIKTSSAVQCYYDWAGGLVWLAHDATGDGGASLIRSSLSSGHAMLFRAPDHLRREVSVFQPQPPALAALASRVKEAFDPRGILNPGLMAKS
jgi:glycolate oxidase FAD binding subunit